jgi:hypothetical protein
VGTKTKSAGKGDKRRPTQVSQLEADVRWAYAYEQNPQTKDLLRRVIDALDEVDFAPHWGQHCRKHHKRFQHGQCPDCHDEYWAEAKKHYEKEIE